MCICLPLPTVPWQTRPSKDLAHHPISYRVDMKINLNQEIQLS